MASTRPIYPCYGSLKISSQHDYARRLNRLINGINTTHKNLKKIEHHSGSISKNIPSRGPPILDVAEPFALETFNVVKTEWSFAVERGLLGEALRDEMDILHVVFLVQKVQVGKDVVRVEDFRELRCLDASIEELVFDFEDIFRADCFGSLVVLENSIDSRLSAFLLSDEELSPLCEAGQFSVEDS
ncbi:hypothetical protein HUJ04_010965 [Dendroctonus ponderosae]|nr:hypothetical protein HUJ04_010965 [Dendroctonus ponderosae]